MGILKSLATRVATNAPKMAKAIATVARAKSPVIFAGTAVLGTGVIAYTTYKCTPKYTEAIIASKTKVTKNEDGTETITTEAPITRKEKTRIFVKTMWPALVAIIVTATSVIASQKINTKRIATLSAAYTIATQKATEAAEKRATEFIKDKFGEEGAKQYTEKCEKEHKDEERTVSAATGRLSGDVVYETGSGDVLFMLKDTHLMFRGSMAYIRAKMEALNSACPDPEIDPDWYTFNDIQSIVVPGCEYLPILDKVGYSREEVALHNIELGMFIEDDKEMPNGEMCHILAMNVRPEALPNC